MHKASKSGTVLFTGTVSVFGVLYRSPATDELDKSLSEMMPHFQNIFIAGDLNENLLARIML